MVEEPNQWNDTLKETAKIAVVTTVAGTGTAVVGTTVGTTALSMAGFTSSGIAAGSFAAGVQASIGNVVAGSAFATLQSVGATGGLALIGPVGLGLAAVGATAAVGIIIYKKATQTPKTMDQPIVCGTLRGPVLGLERQQLRTCFSCPIPICIVLPSCFAPPLHPLLLATAQPIGSHVRTYGRINPFIYFGKCVGGGMENGDGESEMDCHPCHKLIKGRKTLTLSGLWACRVPSHIGKGTKVSGPIGFSRATNGSYGAEEGRAKRPFKNPSICPVQKNGR